MAVRDNIPSGGDGYKNISIPLGVRSYRIADIPKECNTIIVSKKPISSDPYMIDLANNQFAIALSANTKFGTKYYVGGSYPTTVTRDGNDIILTTEVGSTGRNNLNILFDYQGSSPSEGYIIFVKRDI